MRKLPRDLTGDDLASLLRRHYGYEAKRQRGSHLTVTTVFGGSEHSVTIPRHRPVRVGTLNAVVSAVAEFHGLAKQEVRQKLFGR